MSGAKSIAALLAAVSIVFLSMPLLSLSQTSSQQTLGINNASAYRVQHVVEFSRADLSFDKLTGFDIVRLRDGDQLAQVGKPMLPSKEIKIALPSGMAARSVQILNAIRQEIPGEYIILPAQPPRRIGFSDQDTDFVEPDPKTYSSSQPYPSDLLKFVRQGDLAGQGIAVIRFYPLQYVPVEKKLMLYTSIAFVVEGVEGHERGDYLSPNVSERGRKTYEQMIRDMVINPADVQLRTGSKMGKPSALPGGQFEHVVITSPSYATYFQPLVDWHTQKGLKDTIITTSWIYSNYAGADTQQVRSFVIDADSTWGTIYFLLGGEHETVPFAFRTYMEDAENTPSDQYYSDFDDDWIHEVFVGRVSVGSTSEVTTFVNKVLKYEKAPPRSDYPLDILFIGMDYDDDTQVEELKESIDTSCIPSRFNVAKVYDSHGGNHEDSVIYYLNAGQNLVNHGAHAGINVMGTGYHNHGWMIVDSDVDALTNSDQMSVLVSPGCNANHMDYEDCIAEHFVIYNPNQAGVAFTGNTRLGVYLIGDPYGLSNALDRQWWTGLFTGKRYNLAQTLVYSKHLFGTDAPEEEHCEWTFNLLGEPEMPVWTDEPASFAVSHPSALPAGVWSFFSVWVQDSITLAPAESAYVCLWKGNEVYLTGYTDATGRATLEPSPDTEGMMYVTVTKHNYVPYQGEADAIFILPPDITQLDTTYVPWAKISENTNDQPLLGIRMDNASGMDYLESVVLKSFIEKAFSVEYVKLYAETNGTRGLQVGSDQLLAQYNTHDLQFDTNDTLKLNINHYMLSGAPDSNLFYIAVDVNTDSVGAAPPIYHEQRLEVIIEPGRIELASGTNPDTVYNRPDWTAPDPLTTGFVPGLPGGRYRLWFDTQKPQFDVHFCVPEELHGPGDSTVAQGDSIQICATNVSADIKGPITIVDSKKIFLLDLIALGSRDSTDTESCPTCDTNWNVAFRIPDMWNAGPYPGVDGDSGQQWTLCAWAEDSAGNIDTMCIQGAPELIWKIDTRKPAIDSIQFYLSHDQDFDGIAEVGDSLCIVAWGFWNPDWEVDSMVADLRAYFPTQPSKQWQELDDRQENNRLFQKKIMLEEEPVDMSADSVGNRTTVWAWDNACNYDTLQWPLYTGVCLYPFAIEGTPDRQFVRAGQFADYNIIVTSLVESPSPCTLTVTGMPPDGSAGFNPAILVPTDSSLMMVYTTENTETGTYDLIVTAAELGKAKIERSTHVVLIVTESDTLWISSIGKVDLIVTDPVADSISLDTNTIQDATYEAPTDTTDVVTIPHSLVGEYLIRVIGQPNAVPGDSYVVGIRIDGSMENWGDPALVPPPGESDEYSYTSLPYLRGDANGDGQWSAGDIVFLLNYLFRFGLPPEPLELGDANCDEAVNAGDVVYMINYLFRDGDPPRSW